MTDGDTARGKKRFNWPGCILGFIVMAALAWPALAVAGFLVMELASAIAGPICTRWPGGCTNYPSGFYGIPDDVARWIVIPLYFTALAAIWWAVYKVVARETRD